MATINLNTSNRIQAVNNSIDDTSLLPTRSSGRIINISPIRPATTLVANQHRSAYVNQLGGTGYIGNKPTSQDMGKVISNQVTVGNVMDDNRNAYYGNRTAETFNRGTSMGRRMSERMQPPMPMEQAQQKIIRTKKQRTNRNKKYVTEQPIRQVQSYDPTRGNYDAVHTRVVNDSVDRAIGNILFSTGGYNNEQVFTRQGRVIEEEPTSQNYMKESRKLKPMKSQRMQKQNKNRMYDTQPQRGGLDLGSIMHGEPTSIGGVGNMLFSRDDDIFVGRGRLNDMSGRDEADIKPIKKRKQRMNHGKGVDSKGSIDLDFGLNDNAKSSMQDTINKLIF